MLLTIPPLLTVVKIMSYMVFKIGQHYLPLYQLKKINTNKPLLKNMSTVRAQRGCTYLSYTEFFEGTEKELHFVGKKNLNVIQQKPCMQEKDRGINEDRKKNILKNLLALIPKHKLEF